MREAVVVFLFATSITAGCNGVPSAPSDVSEEEAVKSLVAALRESGAAVHPVGVVSQPFFTVQGQRFNVDGKVIEVFEFASADEADTVALTVSADGSSVGTSLINWVAPPHFYKAGQLIVIYVTWEATVASSAHSRGLWDPSSREDDPQVKSSHAPPTRHPPRHSRVRRSQ